VNIFFFFFFFFFPPGSGPTGGWLVICASCLTLRRAFASSVGIKGEGWWCCFFFFFLFSFLFLSPPRPRASSMAGWRENGGWPNVGWVGGVGVCVQGTGGRLWLQKTQLRTWYLSRESGFDAAVGREKKLSWRACCLVACPTNNNAQVE
jgi:hypothetical protein